MIKGYIYTNSIERGREKLEEIIKEKREQKVTILKQQMRVGYVLFSDESSWQIALLQDGARGIKWDKCYVDTKTVTLEQYQLYILPSGIYAKEKARFFR